MMNAATLRLVLLISCCHAMVHVYEHSLAAVEKDAVRDEAFGIQQANQETVSGELGNCLRLPFGLCALLAGWLAERLGAKRLLLGYLFGCSLAAVLAWYAPNLLMMAAAMFTLGLFASVYHPAGLGLISDHTTPENRPRALGLHGIFGSAGIAAGPFLAALVFQLPIEADWRQYYLVLAVPGVLLAALLALRLPARQSLLHAAQVNGRAAHDEDDVHWPSYFLLIALVSLAGFVYAAVLHFLPRYLSGTGLEIAHVPDKSLRNYLAAVVLMLGVIGQYTAGRIAKPTTLEPLLALAFLASAPCVFWMGYANGHARIWAAGLFSPLFFMHQPVFNSLVAKYVPRRRRSLCYGLSFTVAFGVGSFGPNIAGHIDDYRLRYGGLAVVLGLAGTLALVLWRWHGPVPDPQKAEHSPV